MAEPRLKPTDGIALVALFALLATFLANQPGRISVMEAGLTVAFAAVGWLLRGVSIGGALAGLMVALILYGAAGWRMFLVLLGVFVLTLAATLFGRSRKSALGLAEPSEGRSAAQVGANLVVAAAALVLLPETLAAAVSLAALCEAAADTVSSEVGEAIGGKTYLLLTLEPTKAGVNGGVSLAGTMAGVAAAACIAGLGLTVMDPRFAVTAFAGGVAGMMIDSLLGASLENDGYLNNDAVNLGGTAVAAGLAWLLCAS